MFYMTMILMLPPQPHELNGAIILEKPQTKFVRPTKTPSAVRVFRFKNKRDYRHSGVPKHYY